MIEPDLLFFQIRKLRIGEGRPFVQGHGPSHNQGVWASCPVCASLCHCWALRLLLLNYLWVLIIINIYSFSHLCLPGYIISSWENRKLSR